MKQALKDLDIDEKRYRPGSVHAAISRAINELILPEDYPVTQSRDEVVLRIYEKYQELLLEWEKFSKQVGIVTPTPKQGEGLN